MSFIAQIAHLIFVSSNKRLKGFNMSNKIIRLPAVKEKTGLSRSSIYLRMSKGEFPPSISLGDRAIGWVEIHVENWIEDKIEASKNAGDNHE
jgi:prophage regulatory protein